MKIRAILVAALASLGCDLSSGANKTHCLSERDCLEGYGCIDQVCTMTGSGGDAGSGAVDMAVDGVSAPGLGCAGTVVDGGCLRGSWKKLADMPTPRAFLALVAVPDGRLFALGGTSQATGALATVEVYSPALDSWTTVKPMAAARSSFGAALGRDGRIYVMGGPYGDGSTTSSGASTLVEAYDLASDTWSPAPSLKSARSDSAAVAGGDGRLYAIGGVSGLYGTLGSWEALQPGDGSWAQSNFTMTTPRSSHALAVAPDGRIFALGGIDKNGDKLMAVEWFTPEASGWMTAAPMTKPRAWLAATTGADGKIYAIGGNGFNAGGVSSLTTVEAYSPTENRWETVAPLPTGRFALAAATDKDGKIYAIGGDDLPTVEVFTP